MPKNFRESDFRTVFERASIGVALVDCDGVPFLSNRRLQEMLGYSAEALSNMPFPQFTHPDDRDNDRALYGELIAGDRDHYQIEKRYFRKDRTLLHASVGVSLVRAADHSARFAILMVEDISSEIRAAEALKDSHQKLRILNAQLEQRNEQLQQFAYATSHDLKEPLRTVSNFSQLLEETLQTEIEHHGQASDYMTFVKDGVRRMQGMIPTVTGHRAQLRRVFQNLFANSIKFTGNEAPEISVTYRPPDGDEAMHVIIVSDKGTGFDPKHAEAVFQPFRRFANNSVPGSGMGLTISRQMINLHGGSITAESCAGQGASIIIKPPTTSL
ncbi:MAG: PAS domain S-box protein [Verrucomicrobiae bacterium]|nr:PAS domain S-box protein [Verrucomicrobiae bacterium]